MKLLDEVTIIDFSRLLPGLLATITRNGSK